MHKDRYSSEAELNINTIPWDGQLSSVVALDYGDRPSIYQSSYLQARKKAAGKDKATQEKHDFRSLHPT